MAFIKKILCVLIALTMLLSTVGCGDKEPKVNVDQKNLYGMCYIAYEGVTGNNWDYKLSFELMHNMGVTSYRHWMHFGWVLDTPTQINQEKLKIHKELIAEAQKYDMQVIGMNHQNLNELGWMSPKPYARNMDNPDYVKWLEDYEQCWYTLVSAFPEITYWEIDNEPENDDFMYLKYKDKEQDGRVVTMTITLIQKARIYTDMLYYASKGIKRANPNAITVFGGMAGGLGTGKRANFVQHIYDNIKSGNYGEGNTNPDKYFDCMAYHPYFDNGKYNAEAFVEEYHEIDDVVYKNEKKHKKMFLTECGFSEYQMSEEMKAHYVKELYTLIKNECPLVESCHFFRMYDDYRDRAYMGKTSRWGLFYEPDITCKDEFNGQIVRAGAPKPSAYAFQEVSGGVGSLTIYEDFNYGVE